MTKQIFSLVLLISFFQKTHTENHVFITLEHWAIPAIDGRSPGMNGDSLIDCLQVRGLINELIHGKPDQKTRTFKKVYSFNNQLVSLEDLVKFEADNNLTSNHILYEEFRECLKAMRETFVDFTKPLLGEAEVARQTNMHLIEEWCNKSNRQDSLLLHWGKVDEKDTLEKACAKEFYSFCVDLKNFLHDLMYNCPKARELFKVQRLSMMALKETFIQLTAQTGAIFEVAINRVIEKIIKNEDKNHSSSGSIEQKIDRRKKQIYKSESLSEDVFQALNTITPELDKQLFIKKFEQNYHNKCAKFDAQFIARH
jgi:hypothetical protein